MAISDWILSMISREPETLNCEDCGKLCHKCECAEGPLLDGERI